MKLKQFESISEPSSRVLPQRIILLSVSLRHTVSSVLTKEYDISNVFFSDLSWFNSSSTIVEYFLTFLVDYHLL